MSTINGNDLYRRNSKQGTAVRVSKFICTVCINWVSRAAKWVSINTTSVPYCIG